MSKNYTTTELGQRPDRSDHDLDLIRAAEAVRTYMAEGATLDGVEYNLHDFGERVIAATSGHSTEHQNAA